MKLPLIIRNLLSGRAHDAPPLVTTPLETALLDSLAKEPHLWRISKASTPDRGEFLLAANGEKGVVVGSNYFGEARAWSGKLEFGPMFAEIWASEVSELHRTRVAAETKTASDLAEKQLKAAFKL